MANFDRWPWRKLYCIERGSFAALPLYARALAAELLKFSDDDGRIWVGAGDPIPALARMTGAHQGDVRLLRKHIPELLADGYLIRDGEHIVIRNQARAQRGGRESDSSPARVPREAPAQPPSDTSRQLAAAWVRGIQEGSGRPCTVPSRPWDLDALARSVQTHAPAAEQDGPENALSWVHASARAFAASRPQGGAITVERWEAWLNAGGASPSDTPPPPFEELPESIIPPPRWKK
jgi:hypothetical protein